MPHLVGHPISLKIRPWHPHSEVFHLTRVRIRRHYWKKNNNQHLRQTLHQIRTKIVHHHHKNPRHTPNRQHRVIHKQTTHFHDSWKFANDPAKRAPLSIEIANSLAYNRTEHHTIYYWEAGEKVKPENGGDANKLYKRRKNTAGESRNV